MSAQARKVMRGEGEPTVRVSLGGGLTIGDGSFVVIAGPCALENAEPRWR
jgi:3-deoxy-D-arabino-heptulosonate 7-phosphate (DAHP) synthase